MINSQWVRQCFGLFPRPSIPNVCFEGCSYYRTTPRTVQAGAMPLQLHWIGLCCMRLSRNRLIRSRVLAWDLAPGTRSRVTSVGGQLGGCEHRTRYEHSSHVRVQEQTDIIDMGHQWQLHDKSRVSMICRLVTDLVFFNYSRRCWTPSRTTFSVQSHRTLHGRGEVARSGMVRWRAVLQVESCEGWRRWTAAWALGHAFKLIN